MCRIRHALAAATVLAAAPGLLFAQAEHGHGGAASERLGRVVFPTECLPGVQVRFERAVALLHSFWYEEAARAFADVATADSACGMGYWGQAMSLLHPLWAPPTAGDAPVALASAERAVRLTRPGSRDRAYAEAIATFWRGYRPARFRDQLLAYENAMGALVRAYPSDAEGRAFYALALIAVGQLDAGDTSYARQRRAGEILEPLFQKDPNHPGLAHYLIHAYDSPPLAGRAVGATARYARIAPSVPHAQHMPSHIYTRLGRWDASIACNLRSAAAAKGFERRQHLGALWDQRGHALDYLVYAYLQEGRDREAKRVVDEAGAVTAGFPKNSLTNDYALAAIPARYALERGQWAEARTLAVRPAPSWRATEAITYFARAIGSARSGDGRAARSAIDSLASLETALAAAGGPQAYWATQVRIQRLAAEAWAARAAGDTALALARGRAAADLDEVTAKHPVTPGAVLPPRELYGDLLLELGRAAEARAAYEASLARQPNRARSLFGAAQAAALAGDRASADRWYREFAALMAKGDGHRAEIALAKRALARD